MKLIRRFGAIISLLLISMIILSGCAPTETTDNLYTKNVYPDTIGGPFTIGDTGLPYGAGYFSSLYINGNPVNPNGSGGGGIINESTQTTLTGFLKGDGANVYADNSSYLLTDGSNGPITGDLGVDGTLTAAEIHSYGNVSDSVASNNSIYLSTDTGNLSYKDTTGNVHMFAWQ